MKNAYFFLLLTVFMLFGAQAQANQRKVNVVYIGNSITYASGQETAPPKAAAEYLMDEGYLVQYENCGISGYTTVNFRPPGGTYNTITRAADVFYKDKDALLVFSIMLGTNDSAIKGTTGAPVSPETYKANLKLIADSLHQRYPGCKVVLNRPTWYSLDTQNSSASYLQEGLDRLQSYFPEIKELANENPTFIYEGDTAAFNFFKANATDEYYIPQVSPSGVTYYLHPNQKGSTKLGEFWAINLKEHLVEWGYDLDNGRKRVLCIGNSITNGALLENTDRYPTIVQSILGEEYNVKNYGIGNRTMLSKGDYPYVNEERYAKGLEWNPDVVIILLGTNDVKSYNWQYKDDFIPDYKNFIAPFQALENKPDIYICYPTPLFPNNSLAPDSRLTDELIPMINTVAQETGVKIIDLHTPLVGVEYCTYDYVHPNKKGTNIMAREVVKAICPACEIPPFDPTLFVQAESADYLGNNYNNGTAIGVGTPSSNRDNSDYSGTQILNTWDGNFAVYKNIDFGTDGLNAISIRKNIPRGSRIEVWMDRTIDETTATATGGALIGTIEVPSQISTSQKASTATPTVWKILEEPLNVTLTGIHDICLVFRSGSNAKHDEDLGMLNWFEFFKMTTAPESLTVPSEKINLQIGSSYKITPSLLPTSVDRALNWEIVEGKDVVGLGVDGKVTGIKKGTALVKVSSENNPTLTKLIQISVEDNQYQLDTFRIEGESVDYALDSYHWGGDSNKIRAGELYDKSGQGLIYLWHGNAALYKDVDFGYGGTSEIEIRRNFPRESFIEVWLDRTLDESQSPAVLSSGQFIKSFFIEGTDGWSITKTVTFEMPEITGVHNFYLQFYSAGDTKPEQQHGQIDWFGFNKNIIMEGTFVPENTDSKIVVYPNPVTHFLNLEFSENIKEIKIIATNGKLVYENLKIKSLKASIPVNSYIPGIYFVKIQTESGEKTIKFIKS